jgi:hypothetical protein
MIQSRHQQLIEIQNNMKAAFRTIMDGLEMIASRRLYDEVGCASMEEYIESQWSEVIQCDERSPSWLKQMRASIKMALRISQEFGISLGNEAAARALRTVNHRNSELVEQVIRTSNAHAQRDGQPLTSKYINAVYNTLLDTVATGGFVDTGDGTMTAFDKAINADAYEAHERQQEYSRNGWSKPTTFPGSWYAPGNLIDSLLGQEVPRDATIEIKWRIVPQEGVAGAVVGDSSAVGQLEGRM